MFSICTFFRKTVIKVKPIDEPEMKGEHFCVEIEFNHGKEPYNMFCHTWRHDPSVPSAMKSGEISYFYKVSGEKKFIMFIKIDGNQLDDFLYNKIYTIRDFEDQIKINVTAMYDYVTFANLASTLTGSEKKYEEIQSINNQEGGAYHLLDIKMEHSGMSHKDFLDIWEKEIAAALGAKKMGIAIDIWKVLGERRVLAVTKIESLPALDQIILTLPMMKEMGDQMYITTKRLTEYTKFKEQPR